MAYYKDLREHLRVLEERGKLIRIKRKINKDTQLHPLVRLQYRGLPEEDRKAFIFENVTDEKGREYNSPVAVAALAASREVYAMGLMCKPEEIMERWREAQLNPIKPRIVGDGPVHEEIHAGDNLLEHGGLDEFPIPISTPGYDAGPFFTSPYWVTKDPETKTVNIGTYRAHVKSPLRTGILVGSPNQHIGWHLDKCAERGIPLQAAVVVGASPNIGYVSSSRVPYEMSEFECAGGLAGEPLEIVRCKTVDLEVPATAEIVFEGELSTKEYEPEAPFGEAFGYMGGRGLMPYFTIKCITHRKNPIWQSFISQFPPSESSKLRGVANEALFYKYIMDDLGIPHIIEVSAHEASAGQGVIAIKFKGINQDDAWRALEGASQMWGESGRGGRMFIAVDDDIDARDADALNWAIFTRVQPHRDIRIKKYDVGSLLDYSTSDPSHSSRKGASHQTRFPNSHILINATMKWPYPPLSLPKKVYMEDALKIWQEEGLPPLNLKEPWWGHNLGLWSDEEEEHANLAAKGEYYKVGDILAQMRKMTS